MAAPFEAFSIHKNGLFLIVHSSEPELWLHLGRPAGWARLERLRDDVTVFEPVGSFKRSAPEGAIGLYQIAETTNLDAPPPSRLLVAEGIAWHRLAALAASSGRGALPIPDWLMRRSSIRELLEGFRREA